MLSVFVLQNVAYVVAIVVTMPKKPSIHYTLSTFIAWPLINLTTSQTRDYLPIVPIVWATYAFMLFIISKDGAH